LGDGVATHWWAFSCALANNPFRIVSGDSPIPAEAPLQQPGTLRALDRALAHRNYPLFFIGKAISLIGTWMTRIATG
jgi:hypothetical protein